MAAPVRTPVTSFGSDRAGNPTGLAFFDTAGVEYRLWVNSSGELIIGSVTGFQTPNTVPGTSVAKKVGAQ